MSNAGLHTFDQKSGILFFTEMQNNAITCWNSKNAFKPMHFDTVDKSNVTLIYPNDLNVNMLQLRSNRCCKNLLQSFSCRSTMTGFCGPCRIGSCSLQFSRSFIIHHTSCFYEFLIFLPFLGCHGIFTESWIKTTITSEFGVKL